MVTASQLQLLQSPITALVSSISTSVNVKLDDSNYLNWHFQMKLLLESNGILGFVDGSHPCPARFVFSSGESEIHSSNSSSSSVNDEYLVWMMHDKALMQLLTASLSPVAMSCAIGSTSSRDLWIQLQEQFSTISKTSIFQMKSNLQTIKKGSDSITQYLQKIKEARDYLSAAGVSFLDEDIVILALNGLPAEYNTFRTVIRGRESVISLKEFRTQLLAEEAILESTVNAPFLTAMVAHTPPSRGSHQSSFVSGGFKQFNANKNKGKGRFNQHSRSFSPRQYMPTQTHVLPTPSPGILGQVPYMQQPISSALPEKSRCQLCGRFNHSTWFCFYNEQGPNYIGGGAPLPYSQMSPHSQQGYPFSPVDVHPQQRAQSHFPRHQATSQAPLHAYHTMVSQPTPSPATPSTSQVWITDSGATNHMTADFSNLSLASPYPTNEVIQTANGEGLHVSHIGNAVIKPSMHPIKLNSVLYVPKLSQNLLSVHKICLDNNCWLIFDAFCFWIQDKATGRILYKGLCSNGLYPISSLANVCPAASQGMVRHKALLGQLVNSFTWHNRLGHPSNSVVSLMLHKSNVVLPKTSSSVLCQSCLEGKFCKLPFYPSVNKSVIPFEVVHSDLWGPAPCVSVDGYRYYVTFIDECTKFSWLFPLVNKSDFCTTFIGFYAYVLTQFSAQIRILQSDGGGEYISKPLQSFLLQKGILHQKSCPYTPEQNGMAERKHRHVIETAVTLLQTAQMPPKFWSFACQTAIYLINRMPTPILSNQSPFEVLYGAVPVIHHLRTFGCACYPLLRPYNTTKLQPKTTKCIFLGYASRYKGFICYVVSQNRFFISRHVVFSENDFPYKDLLAHTTSKSSCSVILDHQPSPPIVTPHHIVTILPQDPHTSPVSSSLSPSPSPTQSPCHASPSFPQSITGAVSDTHIPVVLDHSPETLQVVPSIPPLNLHPMQTRSKSGISKKKVFLSALAASKDVDLSICEPSTYKSALKSSIWFQAMQEEISALHGQGTWSLVSLPVNKNLVGCKWVFKIKRHSDGSIARHKARLVAKGFSQEPGIDYSDTFSPVVKPTTVRIVLALAAHFHWSLRQLDVKNAFLHGILQEEVYMAQPPGFEDPQNPTLVCKLHKSLYGLKQAPRAWNDRFTTFLPTLGFQHTYSDSSLFVKPVGSDIVILLLYVDDIIITGSAHSAIQQVIDALTSEFDIKDLGPLHFFLGIQISQTPNGLFLSQQKYIQELLVKTEMHDSKACDTPCLPYNRLLKDDGEPYPNPSLYRSVVGALQYLTFTRPDIAFSVHQVSQFMQNPMASHFTAVKRILRYLKGTVDVGLTYSRGDLDLHAFSDADWAGDPNDRRSTTGLVVFLGNNPISWSSKKQQTVSRSSTEAEYRALSSTTAELDWIQQILAFLHLPISAPPVLFCDNLSAIALSFNPVQHQRTKHIEVDVHFVRERVATHKLLVQFVSSKEQFADILTKGLSAPLFRIHCNNLMLGPSKYKIEGG
ncbi:hypothetical protein ACFX12_005393 [Malus domestica]